MRDIPAEGLEPAEVIDRQRQAIIDFDDGLTAGSPEPTAEERTRQQRDRAESLALTNFLWQLAVLAPLGPVD